MDPEKHLTVRFLRFLKFDDAADLFVQSLLSPEVGISLHSKINTAVTELAECINTLPQDGFFAFKMADLFTEIADKHQLHQLDSVLENNPLGTVRHN
ncbi:hypothetical protein [Legionella cardiaca]|uniref:Uncharacterized protein n=1 Tax=Legionella cardiaca TaxID=1071983 RepID=A0ABY8AXY2_9GAMM|nr:hypothetical protein [Legionella cardiaca]WED44365.1 hypothetical protein PXX05_06140 [Legionella cardiaca]